MNSLLLKVGGILIGKMRQEIGERVSEREKESEK